MNLKRAGRAAAVLAAVCAAGLGNAAAAAAAQPVAWGTTNSAPAGALGELFGVAAASSSDVLAVGGFNPGQPPTAVLIKPYAEHWTGAAWSATGVPLGQVYPNQAAQLNGVTEAAPGDGWAVGAVSDLSSLASRTPTSSMPSRPGPRTTYGRPATTTTREKRRWCCTGTAPPGGR